METLIDWLNVRTFAAAAVLATAVFLGAKFQEHPRDWYRRWRYTSQTEQTPLASEIERDLDARASSRLRALHREVSEEISRAVAEGFAVGLLQKTADGILQLDTPALRSQGIDRLQKLRLTIPRKTPKLRVADDADGAEETEPPRVRSAARSRRRLR